jgi:hypothetical protein
MKQKIIFLTLYWLFFLVVSGSYLVITALYGLCAWGECDTTKSLLTDVQIIYQFTQPLFLIYVSYRYFKTPSTASKFTLLLPLISNLMMVGIFRWVTSDIVKLGIVVTTLVFLSHVVYIIKLMGFSAMNKS